MEPADLQHDEVEGTEALRDFLVLGRKPAVAAEEHAVLRRADDERGPERAVPALDGAAGEMLRRRRRDGDLAQRVRLPPVELGDACRRHAPGLEMRADA